MPVPVHTTALVVHSGPFLGRSSRDQLDVALAAASVGMDLELFFLGEGILQLLFERETGGLPAGIKGWKALPGLCEVNAWASARTVQQYVPSKAGLVLDVRIIDDADIGPRLAACDRVMVI